MGFFLGLIKQNLLLAGIITALALAWAMPGPGIILEGYKLSSYFIILIFLFQGAGLTGRQLLSKKQLLGLLVWGAVVSQLLGPVTGYAVVKLLGWEADLYVGFLLICCMAPTLVSGIVMATRAGGDAQSAIFITVALNLLAIFIIPLNLSWLLGAVVPVDQGGLFFKLVTLVLIPSLAGYLFRQWRGEWVERGRGLIQYGPIAALAVVIYLTLSPQAERIREVEALQIAAILLPSLLAHLVLLLAGYFGGRYLFRIEEAANRSLAIVCSQKTLPIALAIWTVTFAQAYPLAIIPPLVFHFGQIITDGLIVNRWRRI
jgi:predicted Na+-dependent transporter